MNLSGLFQGLAIVLALSVVFGGVFEKLRMPKVIGEILAGVVLGPALLGQISPEYFDFAVKANEQYLSVFATLGLVLLMFLSGSQIEADFSRSERKIITALSVASIVVPLLIGWCSTFVFDTTLLMGPRNDMKVLRVIIAVAVAVTSIPVISKIFLDLGIMNTRFAKIVLSVAGIHDIFLFALLGFVMTYGKDKPVHTYFFPFIVLGIVCVIVLLKSKISGLPALPEIIRKNKLGLLFITLSGGVAFAAFFGIEVIFPALALGFIIKSLGKETFEKEIATIRDFSFAIFIPAYFCMVGLKLDFTGNFSFSFFCLFTIFSLAVLGVAVVATSRLLKLDWPSSVNLATALNARGGPCIVLATTAYDAGYISAAFFTTLILLALVTSLIAGVWLKYILAAGKPLLNPVNQPTTTLFQSVAGKFDTTGSGESKS